MLLICIPRKRFTKRIGLGVFQLLVACFLVIFVFIPLIFKFSYSMQRSSVFLTKFSVDPDSDFFHPSKYDLAPARNFYLTSNEGVTLGVWHILPENMPVINTTDQQEPYPDHIINNGQRVVIYCHGNSGNRVNDFRINLYKVLRRRFHVITFDYRSYGDSSQHEPSESKLVEDAFFIYKWIRNKTQSHIFIWGHSLGSNIALQTLRHIQNINIGLPAGVILESPFNNMEDEISEFGIAKFFTFLPWFSYTIVQPMIKNGFKFESDRHICDVDVPILILHSEDDKVVPYKLGRKLYKAAQSCRRPSQGSVTFVSFDSVHQYNHRHLTKDPQIPDIIRTFETQAVNHARGL